MNTAGWCDAAYIFGCRKFSASVVNGQNDSMIFCIRVTRGIVSALHPSMARESIRRRLLSYSSRSTLMTHTDTPNTSKQSSEEASCWHQLLCCQVAKQFAVGCFCVHRSFIRCGIDALHVNDILCCTFLSK